MSSPSEYRLSDWGGAGHVPDFVGGAEQICQDGKYLQTQYVLAGDQSVTIELADPEVPLRDRGVAYRADGVIAYLTGFYETDTSGPTCLERQILASHIRSFIVGGSISCTEGMVVARGRDHPIRQIEGAKDDTLLPADAIAREALIKRPGDAVVTMASRKHLLTEHTFASPTDLRTIFTVFPDPNYMTVAALVMQPARPEGNDDPELFVPADQLGSLVVKSFCTIEPGDVWAGSVAYVGTDIVIMSHADPLGKTASGLLVTTGTSRPIQESPADIGNSIKVHLESRNRNPFTGQLNSRTIAVNIPGT